MKLIGRLSYSAAILFGTYLDIRKTVMPADDVRCDVMSIDKKPRKAANSHEIREQFSELQTEWRRTQSVANPSLSQNSR
jgi:hypothetical protein